MQKQRVVFVPYKIHIRHLLHEMGKKVELTVLLPPGKSLPQNTSLKSVRIHYLEFGARILKRLMRSEVRTLKYVPRLSNILDDLNFDTLITCEFYQWFTLQCITYKKHHPDFKLFVISETKRWPRNILAHCFKRVALYYFRKNITYVDHVLVYTEAARDFLAKYVPEAKVALLPVPTNTELFTPSIHKHVLPDGILRLLMSARYSPYKRHKDLFEALGRLRAHGHSVHLSCISSRQKGRVEIQKLARSMGVDDMVTFFDPMPFEQLQEFYHKHDVLVLPSYNEAIGMVVPEAMACGLPTITSDTVGANVYVVEGETGFIYKTGDVKELTKALEKCFNVKLLERMGCNAHEHIMKNFTPEALASRFHSLLCYNTPQ